MAGLRRRAATMADAATLLAWRNDDETRRWSFRGEEIDPAAHARWLADKLQDAASELYVFERDGRPVAHVRVDIVEPRTGGISVVVAPSSRGLGIGTDAIRDGTAAAAAALGLDRVVAHIKEGNTASVRSFRAAGYADTAVGETVLEWRRPTPRRPPRPSRAP